MDLEIIRKLYGERMMHLCRTLFPTILEHEGKLAEIMQNNFAPSKFLFDDIVAAGLENQFKNYIYGYFYIEEPELVESEVVKTPQELLSEAGYVLYDECKTEEEIQSFRKYYASGEELCTFRGGRLNSCRVFFAVKKDVESIKRRDFSKPMRQDKYGTSVISIQFSKGDFNSLSIKNRYNHTVPDCDATFSNDLENIAAGLTESFEYHYGLNLSKTKGKSFELPGYVKASDGKFYKYNYEINNIYYCPGNIIINNFKVVSTYQQMERYIVFDYFILDLAKPPRMMLYDPNIGDSFVTVHSNIKKVNIRKNKQTKNKVVELILEDNKMVTIEIDKENKMVSYENKYIEKMENKFLAQAKSLSKISTPQLKTMGDECFKSCHKLSDVEMPLLEFMGAQCFEKTSVQSLNMPLLKQMGKKCFYVCDELVDINMPMLVKMGDNCFGGCSELKNIYMPSLKKMGFACFFTPSYLEKVSMPQLEEMDGNNFHQVPSLKYIDMPLLKKMDGGFNNNKLVTLNMPQLRYMGFDSFKTSDYLISVSMPLLEEMEGNCFWSAPKLQNINMPSLEETGFECFCCSYSLVNVNAPLMESVREGSLARYFGLSPVQKQIRKTRVQLLNLSKAVINYFDMKFNKEKRMEARM